MVRLTPSPWTWYWSSDCRVFLCYVRAAVGKTPAELLIKRLENWCTMVLTSSAIEGRRHFQILSFQKNCLTSVSIALREDPLPQSLGVAGKEYVNNFVVNPPFRDHFHRKTGSLDSFANGRLKYGRGSSLRILEQPQEFSECILHLLLTIFQMQSGAKVFIGTFRWSLGLMSMMNRIHLEYCMKLGVHLNLISGHYIFKCNTYIMSP